MRKVIESTLLSIDGVIGDPPAWAGEYFDKEAERAALEQLLTSDAMLWAGGRMRCSQRCRSPEPETTPKE